MVFPPAGRFFVLLLLFLVFLSFSLFAGAPGYVERGVPGANGAWYLLVRHQGVLRAHFSNENWTPVNNGLPKRVVFPFDDQGYKDLTALAVDVVDPDRIAVTTSSRLFLSGDGGISYVEIPLNDPVKGSNYITSVALRGDEIYLGTSFNGFFASADGGKRFRKLSDELPQLYRGAGFYEEVSGIAAGVGDELALASSFSGQLYLRDSDEEPWRRVDFPYDDEIRGIWYADAGDQPPLEVWGAGGLYRYQGGEWTRFEFPFLNPQAGVTNEQAERLATAAGRYGLYINPANASGSKLDALLDLVVTRGMNAITVDMKDDRGWLSYDSQLPEAEEVGSIKPRFNLDQLIAACHDRGIYLIGRVVVFKDERMYGHRKNAFAIWDTQRAGPWGNRIAVKNEESGETEYQQYEFWVDPFSREVWEYNLAIAVELQSRGVDEIQFDYIRFPSDGNVSRASYRHRRPGMSRIEALESFLGMVRREISIPISTDLYGFNSWYRMGNWIGQNIELVSHYVDVICPMFYPSHFPGEFLQNLPYLERAERIYREGSTRSATIAGGRSLIRPYVQAFLLPFEYYMEEPEYTEYLTRQLQGTADSPASGFTLWNNTNRYYMLTEQLSRYTTLTERTAVDDAAGMLE